MGAAQPGGVGEEAADDRRRARVAHGELSAHGARLLPRHRRRRRHRCHLRRARQVAEEASRLCAGLRPVGHPRQHLQHAGPDGDRGARGRKGRLPDGQARPCRCRRRRAVRRLHDQHDPVPGRPRLLQERRRRRVRQRRAHRPGRQPCRQHQRRRTVLLSPGHVRAVPPDRGGAPTARRVRRASGRRTARSRWPTAMAAFCPRRPPSFSARKPRCNGAYAPTASRNSPTVWAYSSGVCTGA